MNTQTVKQFGIFKEDLRRVGKTDTRTAAHGA